MKLPHPIRRFSNWYAGKYVCPFWGHKIDDSIEWLDATKDGVLKLAGRTGNYCENCGEVIPREDAS
jgi:hypothetical protein